MSKLAFVIWMIIGFFSYSATASEYGGKDIITGIKTPDHEMSISRLAGGDVYVVWGVKSLLGEPLVSGRGVIIIPSQAYYHVSYKKQRYKVPAEVFKKIKPVNVKVKAKISPTEFVDIDLGAMSDIYFGSSVLFPKLPDVEKYLSFNIPGSPEWGALFYTDNLGLSSGYLSEKQAKVLFEKGVEIIPLGSYAEASFDLNPIKHWIDRQSGVQVKQTVNSTADHAASIETGGAEDPFDKFERMEAAASEEALQQIDADIKSFIINRCGQYYTSVRVTKAFSLSIDYLGESKAEMNDRERREAAAAQKHERKVKQAKREALRELPDMQKRWIRKRDAIKAETRTYVINKYGLEHSIERLNKLLDENFTSVDGFGGIYYISI